MSMGQSLSVNCQDVGIAVEEGQKYVVGKGVNHLRMSLLDAAHRRQSLSPTTGSLGYKTDFCPAVARIPRLPIINPSRALPDIKDIRHCSSTIQACNLGETRDRIVL